MTLIQKLNNYFRDDSEINDAITYLTAKIIPKHIKNESRYVEKLKHFVVKDGKLIYNPKEIKLEDKNFITKQSAYNLEVIPKTEIENVLSKEYNDNKVIGKGVRQFYKYITSKYINIKREDIEEFLRSHQQYQLTRPISHRTNKPIVAKYPNQLWAIDLIDLSPYTDYNYQNRYIITVVDIFSRKIWIEKSKEKSALVIQKEFAKICNRANIKPNSLMSDNGGEFLGEFSEYCKDNDIKQRFVRSHTAQANGVVERKNQEIRKLIKALMIKTNSLKWMNFLDDIEYNLNRTYSSVIKATPEEIWTPDKDS
jgi:IS30 family transposase